MLDILLIFIQIFQSLLSLVGRKSQGGGFVKQLNTGLKHKQIFQYILTGSTDLPEVKSVESSQDSPSSSSKSSSSSVHQGQQEVEMVEEGPTVEKRKVFLYNSDYLVSPVKDNSVDLLITDIPYNVS